MGFSIDYDVGILGALFIGLLVGAGILVLIFFLTAANRARKDIVEEEHDHGHDDIVA